MSRPNIIYIHSHDTGRRISPYGYPVQTPHLQQFASEAVLFGNAFCAAPTCSPSRAALLTGQSPHGSGMLGLHHRGFHLTDPNQHLCRTLLDNGYTTTLIGVNHVISDVTQAGYQTSVPIESSHAHHVAPAAEKWLASAPQEPFFLDIGFVQTHRGVFPSRHADENPDYTDVPASLPNTPETREDAAIFASAARIYDDGVGQVLKALEKAGLKDRTLVISTTDHGISFPRHKCTLFDGGLGVMLMMRGPATDALPNGFQPGSRCDALISQIDLFPTLCEYLDIAPPKWLEGKSILPLLRNEIAQIRDEIFGEITYHAAYQPERAIRTRRYKLIRRFGNPKPQPMSNLDDGLTKSVYAAHGYAQRIHPTEALYDLLYDPQETNNLVADPTMKAVLSDLRNRLDHWMLQTHDPLLKGDVPLPAGAIANDFEDYSPKDVLARVKDQTHAH